MRFKEFKEAFGDDGWDDLIGQATSAMLPGGKPGKGLLDYLSGFSKDLPDPLNPKKAKSSSNDNVVSTSNNPKSKNLKNQPSSGNTSTNSSAAGQRTPASAISGSGKPSEQLIQFVKQNEGFKAKAFWDYKQWTNGYGTKASSRNEVIDEREADRRLRQKAQEFYDIVVRFDQAHKYGFDNSQRDALTSFVFNGGPGWLDQVSDNGRRNKKQIAQAMLNYNTAGGRRLGGLVRRRRQEVAMFNTGSDNMPSSNIG
jgi:hypothetical protein